MTQWYSAGRWTSLRVQNGSSHEPSTLERVAGRLGSSWVCALEHLHATSLARRSSVVELLQCWLASYTTEVLSRRWVCPPRGQSATWSGASFGRYNWGRRCSCHLMGRGQGCCWISSMHRTMPARSSQQIIIQPRISIVLVLRNFAVDPGSHEKQAAAARPP